MFLGERKQDRVSCSNVEVEVQALAQCVCEGLYIKIIPDDLKIKVDIHMKLYYANKSAMNIVHNPMIRLIILKFSSKIILTEA